VVLGEGETCVSLFAYEQARLTELMRVWAQGVQRLHVLVPEGRVLGDVANALGSYRGSWLVTASATVA